jgi:hypothetical protein
MLTPTSRAGNFSKTPLPRVALAKPRSPRLYAYVRFAGCDQSRKSEPNPCSNSLAHRRFCSARSPFNQVSHRLRLRNIYGVTACDLNDTSAGPIRHEPLCSRRNHLVFRSDQVPTGLTSPGRFCDCASERVYTPWHLRVSHECGLFGVDVTCKRFIKFTLVQKQVAVLWWQDWGHRSSGRRVLY